MEKIIPDITMLELLNLKKLDIIGRRLVVSISGCHYPPARDIVNKISAIFVMTLITKAKFFISVFRLLFHTGRKEKNYLYSLRHFPSNLLLI